MKPQEQEAPRLFSSLYMHRYTCTNTHTRSTYIYTKLFLLSVLEKKKCPKWEIGWGWGLKTSNLSQMITYKTEVVNSFVNFRHADSLTTNTKMSTTIFINHLW